ncbi:Importin subunit beta-1 [Linum grandiflorum]
MAMEVTQVLLNAQSMDRNVGKQAEESLRQFEEQNLPVFLLSLSGELANEEKPADSRRLAGLLLKNTLDPKEQHKKYELVQKWLMLDATVKTQIKSCLLKTLTSLVPDARKPACQVIAKIAGIELPQKQWPELIGSLLSNVHQLPAHVKQATLETLGYLCEEVSPDAVDQDNVNKILTVVVQGMSSTEVNTDVRLTAIQALYNALSFAQANFSNDMERDYIMRVVCEAALSKELKIRLAAFECLVIVQKLSSSETTKYLFMQYADQIMGLFLRVFAYKSATVHEEAMLAIGALAYACGPEFDKYMPEFYKYLEIGLQNFEEYQVCAVTVGVVGDICRALENKVLPYCDGMMTQLLKDLSSNQLHRSVKPPIFSCLGDIALAIGPDFEKYLMYAMPMLQSAAELSAHTTGADDDMVEYTNSLRNGILEAYSGIFQGFKNSTKTQLLVPYAPHILQFLDSIYMEKDMDDLVMKTAIGVLGDLADTLGSNAGTMIQNSVSSRDFLNECLSSEDGSIKESAEWTKLAITRAISA